MKLSKLLPPLLVYSTASLYLVGGYVESTEPGRPSMWRKIFGPLTFDLGPNPTQTGMIMMGIDILLFVGLVLYIKRLKRLEAEEAAHGKVTQEQGPFGR
jgi:hypothetical protein